ncbi:MAG: ethanolamine ammonia-lyase subunit EutC [Treponemataceae bacterium]
MISDKELQRIIENVVAEVTSSKGSSHKDSVHNSTKKESSLTNKAASTIDSGEIPDLGLIDMKSRILVKDPLHPEELKRIRQSTPARIAVGRAGTRYKTETILRFRADHATAQDAVFTDVAQETLDSLKLKTYQTKCESRNEYITRPDLGRQFDDQQSAAITSSISKDAQVLIYVSDGLSSTAIEENARDILPIMMDGLKAKGIRVAEPFFVKYGRVGSMDAIGDIAKSLDVICVLIGERPGLGTAGSMSAYFAYKPTAGMPESKRTVISNIHRGGTPAVEAGAHLVDIIKKALDAKASGLDLKI